MALLLKQKQWKQQQKDAKAALAFLESETIAVTAYPWQSVKVNQQRFTDINKNSSKPNSAISMLFDHRDPITGMARIICSTVLNGKVELTKSSVGRASGFLFSINAVRKAVSNLGEYLFEPGVDPTDEDFLQIKEIFEAMVKAMPQWRWSESRIIKEREEGRNLAIENVALEGISKAIAPLDEDGWKEILKGIKGVDLTKDNSALKRAGVVVDGQILKSTKSINALAVVITRQARKALEG